MTLKLGEGHAVQLVGARPALELRRDRRRCRMARISQPREGRAQVALVDAAPAAQMRVLLALDRQADVEGAELREAVDQAAEEDPAAQEELLHRRGVWVRVIGICSSVPPGALTRLSRYAIHSS